jgi:glycosyltransferase involved in cell wall biosynthesis
MISIIVPCYHAEKFINQCLDTIRAQTFKDYEIILVIDDIEADKTVQMVRDHPLWKECIVYMIKRTNKSNPATARNSGMTIARGDYVAFLDVDDTWEPEKLENQYLSMGDADVSFTSGVWHRTFGNFPIILTPERFKDHFNNNLFIWSSVLFKRSALLNVWADRGHIFDPRLSQCDDGDLLIYMWKWGYKFTATEHMHTHIYEHGGNMTQGNLWAPNWAAACNWFRYGYMFNGCKHIAYGVIAVVGSKLGILDSLRSHRMRSHG